MAHSTQLNGTVLAALLLAVLGGTPAAGMGMEEFGPAREHISRQADWPSGIEEVLRHPSRVYWRWINGSESAYYDADVQSMNELLALFSKVDIPEHSVVILPGKREAQSFDRQLTPYVVEFFVPGKLELSARRFDGSAVLHPRMPTLTLALDAKLAERLDELEIPQNVTLEISGVSMEDALSLAQSADANVSARQDAIITLGESGDTSTRVLEVLKETANDDNASIRVASDFALNRITATKKKPDDSALRRRLQEFVANHARQSGATESESTK